jgi:hypothetical protein
MKIRYGFVANSSSATYIITVDLTKDKLYKLIYGSESSYEFEKIHLLGKIEENIVLENKYIQDYEKEIKELDDNANSFRKDCLETTRKNLENSIAFKEKVEKAVYDDIIDLVLEYNNTRIYEKSGKTILEQFTSMHNSYNEGMNDIMKELLFILCFDSNTTFIARMEDNS